MLAGSTLGLSAADRPMTSHELWSCHAPVAVGHARDGTSFACRPATPRRFARADNPPPTAHEAAVLDRIFANWKARHDRVQTLHFTWDCRTTCKKGTEDYSSTSTPRVHLDRDQIFEQLGVQFWIEGDDRRCVVRTASYKLPRSKPWDQKRVVNRHVIVGNTTSSYDAGAFWESGDSPPRTLPRFGVCYPTLTAWTFPLFDDLVLLATFRPQDPSVSWKRSEFRLIDENALLDNVLCIKLKRVVAPQRLGGARMAARVETFWISPARDDVVVRWTSESAGRPTCLGLINYKQDKAHGWIPTEWSCDYAGGDLCEFRVTSYSINEKVDPAIFAQEFPPGTPVSDRLQGESEKQIRYYTIQPDGSRRTISPQEYFWIAGYPGAQKPPAKPQAK